MAIFKLIVIVNYAPITKVILTLVAGPIFGPLFQGDISKSDFKNGHISKSCFVFQVIQVFLSRKFYLSFIS